ncbi:hypothetical protein FOMPIDRAFT_1110294 [Fomitopsis schrenkii]|uniref:Non-ribosomal peptide synthetase n=1 Tax=Fomitopsis schrenkii TaxID=2126942 RepID=S8ELA3_FOMSC|nr:hypothetical protein FOMPIDRAFT_1110294 [Fomitopsis schrenkii]
MSSPPAAITVPAPAYDEAEKGALPDVHTRPLEVSFKDEKRQDLTVSTKVVPVPSEKKPAAPPAKKPPPPPTTPNRILWILWYDMYRKLFTISFSVNIIMFGFAVSGHWPYAYRYGGAMAVGNFNVSVLVRNEIFGRCLYGFVNGCFAKWAPLWWRLGCTSVLQHLGGIHTGCAVSGVIWLTLRTVHVFVNHAIYPGALLAWAVIANLTLFITMVSGFPWLRNSHHNVFERWHRFMGWSGLFSSWIFVLVGDLWDESAQTWNINGVHIVRQQDFWYVMGMTLWIVLPWICTRSVKIDIELPSNKVAVLRFERGMQQGLLGRISRSAVKEYHAFGIISEGPHSKYHYMVCGVQGDFTKSLVNNPPTHIWTRELKLAGVSNTSKLYSRGIRICTGTGIGAALATCIQSPYWYLIWIGSDQYKTFGPTISGLITRNLGPERYLLWDSKVRGGRPDTRKILKEVYHSWKAEGKPLVVFITSNYQGNAEMMQACKEEGIPCFGTLWDFVSDAHPR